METTTLSASTAPTLPVRIWKFILHYKKTAILILLILGGGLWFWLQRSGPAEQETALVQRGTVYQEVNVNGRVSSVNSVNIAFQTNGRVTFVGVVAGQRVYSGQVLLQLDNSTLLAQRQKELANVRLYETRLNQVIAASNIQPTQQSSIAIEDIQEAFKVSVDSMIDFTDLQYTYFNTSTAEDNKLSSVKEEVLKAIYDQTGLGRTGSWYFTTLNTGLQGKMYELENNPETANIPDLTKEVREVLILSRAALEQMRSRIYGLTNATTADKTKVNTALDDIISQLSSLTSQEKTIVDDTFNIEAARVQLEQAKASLNLIDVELVKNSLTAPFSGTVTSVNADRGETVSAGETVVSMISDAKFEIEANVSEADIAKISRGTEANITLDAYGRDRIFQARVVHIDPAGTVSEGVATYRVVLEFQEPSSMILDGMTADIDLRTAEKDDVLYIPSREIITKNARRYVHIKVSPEVYQNKYISAEIISETEDHKIIEVEIKTGLKGSDGRTEIISGLNEGDIIVTR